MVDYRSVDDGKYLDNTTVILLSEALNGTRYSGALVVASDNATDHGETFQLLFHAHF
jgi:hypothetical protein